MTKLVPALESRICDETGQAGDSLETSPYRVQARAWEQVGRDSEAEDGAVVGQGKEAEWGRRGSD